MPLLARLENPQDEEELKKRSLNHFDLVICNLYPFDQVTKDQEKEQIELIDVGGPSLLRAAAKNFEKITVICNPADYSLLENSLSLEQKRKLAVKTFDHLSRYDSKIAQYFQQAEDSCRQKPPFQKQESSSSALPVSTRLSDFARKFTTSLLRKQESKLAKTKSLIRKVDSRQKEESPDYVKRGLFFKKLRYGENPHQKGCWYKNSSGLHQAEILQGKALSFNNILDLQSALNTLREFQEPAFVGVKHNNPCGLALADSLEEAVQKGLKADPLSIFGGIIALNKKVSLQSALHLTSGFLECIIAPDYSETALELFSKKKNLRLLKWPQLLEPFKEDVIYTIDGGFIVQNADQVRMEWKNFKKEGSEPEKEIKKDLETAWKVCAHLKSNAIALVSQGQTVGLGMGQVDRVASVHLAIERMKKHHPRLPSPPVMASDGFFPFEDAVEQAASEGIQWIIQPGGSIRDSLIIKKARSLGISMVLTGFRHFRH